MTEIVDPAHDSAMKKDIDEIFFTLAHKLKFDAHNCPLARASMERYCEEYGHLARPRDYAIKWYLEHHAYANDMVSFWDLARAGITSIAKQMLLEKREAPRV